MFDDNFDILRNVVLFNFEKNMATRLTTLGILVSTLISLYSFVKADESCYTLLSQTVPTIVDVQQQLTNGNLSPEEKVSLTKAVLDKALTAVAAGKVSLKAQFVKIAAETVNSNDGKTSLESAKAVLTSKIDGLMSTESEAKVLTQLNELKTQLAPTSSPTILDAVASLKALFSAKNAAWHHLIDSHSSSLEDAKKFLPAMTTDSTFDQIVDVLNQIHYHYFEGVFIPETIVNVYAALINAKEIAEFLDKTKLQVSKPTPGLTIEKKCQKYHNAFKTSCNYVECPDGVLEENYERLLSVQTLAMEWMKIVTIFKCQKKTAVIDENGKLVAKSFADLTECLRGKEVDDFENWRGNFFAEQELIFRSELSKMRDHKEACSCDLGQYWVPVTGKKSTLLTSASKPSSPSSFPPTKFLCRPCPKDTHTVFRGAKWCLNCEETIELVNDDHEECIQKQIGRHHEQTRKIEKEIQLMQKLKLDGRATELRQMVESERSAMDEKLEKCENKAAQDIADSCQAKKELSEKSACFLKQFLDDNLKKLLDGD